ncbi:hypothetical protein QBC34DRAFT_404592 [Podospora aff. communis PSN243]|uniref:Uncharacterized protein n=1 Tax=Podospora aff. communis PSN243 TaxID=3040156 RepID=A0AAV9GQE1_9PEZI|nr:hypothetical protein QBC34DRAFT_404592 [Podospora aff. communis PSN243]
MERLTGIRSRARPPRAQEQPTLCQEIPGRSIEPSKLQELLELRFGDGDRYRVEISKLPDDASKPLSDKQIQDSNLREPHAASPDIPGGTWQHSNLQTITLILLPTTVVSTFFLSDVVRFHDVDGLLRPGVSWMALARFLSFTFFFGLIVSFWLRCLEDKMRFLLEQRRLEAMKMKDDKVTVPSQEERMDDGHGERSGSTADRMMSGALPGPPEAEPPSGTQESRKRPSGKRRRRDRSTKR